LLGILPGSLCEIEQRQSFLCQGVRVSGLVFESPLLQDRCDRINPMRGTALTTRNGQIQRSTVPAAEKL
jgi:hypothetical protein